MGESRVTIDECPYGKTSQRQVWTPAVTMALLPWVLQRAVTVGEKATWRTQRLLAPLSWADKDRGFPIPYSSAVGLS